MSDETSIIDDSRLINLPQPERVKILTFNDVEQGGYYFSLDEVEPRIVEAAKAVGELGGIRDTKGRGGGTFFIVRYKGNKYLVSAKHCFPDYMSDGEFSPGRKAALTNGAQINLAGTNTIEVVGSDIFVIKLNDPEDKLPSLELADQTPTPKPVLDAGDPCILIGFPTQYLLDRPDMHGPLVSVGRMNAPRKPLGLMGANPRSESGNSGGPILNKNLEVVGVFVSDSVDWPDRSKESDDYRRNSSVAVSVKRFKDLLQ